MLQSIGFETRVATCDQHVNDDAPPNDHHTYIEVLVNGRWIGFDPVLKVLGTSVRAGDRLPEKQRTIYSPDGSRFVSGIARIVPPSQQLAGAYKPPHHDDFIESFVIGLADHMGVSREEAYEQLMHGYRPSEHKALIAHHAAARLPGNHPFAKVFSSLHQGGGQHSPLHGVATLGKWDPGAAARKFFASLDPTNPKAPIGQLIRKGLVMAGSAIGLPVAPLLDGLSNLGDHGAPPPPPVPPPPIAVLVHRAPPPPPPRHIPPPPGSGGHGGHEGGGHGAKKMSTGVKVAIGGGVAAVLVGGIYAATRRKKNPRKKRRSKGRR